MISFIVQIIGMVLTIIGFVRGSQTLIYIGGCMVVLMDVLGVLMGSLKLKAFLGNLVFGIIGALIPFSNGLTKIAGALFVMCMWDLILSIFGIAMTIFMSIKNRE